MRRFSSYGPVNINEHYYAPRTELLQKAYAQLVGENSNEGSHYITVWAPRQTGKTWLMQQILFRLQQEDRFQVLKVNLEHLKDQNSTPRVIEAIAEEIGQGIGKAFTGIDTIKKFQGIFRRDILEKPLVLILDEFDALPEESINAIVSAFRNIYILRTDEMLKSFEQKTYLLHGVALIGVRSVLGIENQKGSPFNIQHSVHVPNLTNDEVIEMFRWYERESGQKVDESVIWKIYDETLGQPGLTCWFGELVTETFNHDRGTPISMVDFREAYTAATHILPNNNILNLISKVNQSPYDDIIMELFKTNEKTEFKFNDRELNYLYMNGVIAEEKSIDRYYVRFASPFVQKSLFDYFSRRYFNYLGQLVHPLDTMDDAITPDTLWIRPILKRYQVYLQKNKGTFFKDVPRRKTDLKVYEAVYHFNLYRYLCDLLVKRGVEVIPEFPTGNGKIDLLLRYREGVYALELKSFRDMFDFRVGIGQAAAYGRQLGLGEIAYVVFVELKEEEIKGLGQDIEESGIRVLVIPIAVL